MPTPLRLSPWDNREFEVGAEVSPLENQQTNIAMNEPAIDPGKGYELPKVDIYGSKEIFSRDRQIVTINRKEIKEFSGLTRYHDNCGIKRRTSRTEGHGDPMSFKGARENSNVMYFDGMKIPRKRNTNVMLAAGNSVHHVRWRTCWSMVMPWVP
ncbi:MAG: hypothetical protein U0176_09800 [Bacteroidia bacterium]